MTGRFGQRDPQGYFRIISELTTGIGYAFFESANLYEYTGNNSVNATDPWGLYTIDKNCCCNIDGYVSNNATAQSQLEKMWQNWKSGETWKDYGLGTFANAAGGRSQSYKNAPKCVQEATDEIENSTAINTTQAIQLGLIGGAGYYNPINWIFRDSGYAEQQWWLTHIAIEKGRAKWFGSKLSKIRSECEKKFGSTYEGGFDKWLECECKDE